MTIVKNVETISTISHLDFLIFIIAIRIVSFDTSVHVQGQISEYSLTGCNLLLKCLAGISRLLPDFVILPRRTPDIVAAPVRLALAIRDLQRAGRRQSQSHQD